MDSCRSSFTVAVFLCFTCSYHLAPWSELWCWICMVLEKAARKSQVVFPSWKFSLNPLCNHDSAKTWTRKPCGIMRCMCKESPEVAGALDICVTYPRRCSWRCLTIKLNFVHLSFHQVRFTTSYISTIQLWTKNCHSCSEFCEFITPGIACGKWQ